MVSIRFLRRVPRQATMLRTCSPAQERNCSSKLKKRMRKPKRMRKTGKMERQPMARATTREQHSKKAEVVARNKKRSQDAVDIHLL
jgi:hypothetical protein